MGNGGMFKETSLLLTYPPVSLDTLALALRPLVESRLGD